MKRISIFVLMISGLIINAETTISTELDVILKGASLMERSDEVTI